MKINLNNFNLLIIIMISAMILISGATNPAACGKEKTTTFNTTALMMDFVENAPPKELVTGLKYPISLDIQNLGGYDIPPGKAQFYLSGIGENLRNVELIMRNTNNLQKRTTFNEGGKERIFFAQNAEPWKDFPNPYNITMKMESCYEYGTVVQSTLCIGGKNGVCNIDEEKIVQNSNSPGPIQITSIKEEIQGNKLYIILNIENKGIGEIYYTTTNCDKLIQRDLNEKQKQNMFDINIETTERDILCTLQNSEAPYGSKQGLSGASTLGKITCVKVLTNEDTHAVPMQITLRYKYKEELSKTISILPS